jgi:SAM-dependent methyltransferase
VTPWADQLSYRTVNAVAWAKLATAGCESSRPYSRQELETAAGWLRRDDWLPWDEIETVLCLASGGGQQAPAFALLGYDVVVADLCREQLAHDRDVAGSIGLELVTVHTDMLDLSGLHGRGFDLVYQPISACYVPDVDALYREVAAVLKPGGWYDVEHWNPVHVQLEAGNGWDGEGYVVSRPQGSVDPVVWTGADDRPGQPTRCWHYPHRLHDLIGGFGRNDLAIHRLVEYPPGDANAPPGSDEHLAAFLPPFVRILARRAE